MEARANILAKRIEPDIDAKVRTSIRFLNETIQYNANEPSSAFYRIQEHVQKTLPTMVQKRYELRDLQEQMNGLIFDIEYDLGAVKHLATCQEHVTNIAIQLEKACYISKQINLFRQQQMQQILFEKKDAPLLSSTKS